MKDSVRKSISKVKRCGVVCPKCGDGCDRMKGHNGIHWCPRAVIGYHP